MAICHAVATSYTYVSSLTSTYQVYLSHKLKAKPLIGKIITVLRAVYREYLSVSNRFEKLQDAYNREQDRNERLKNRLEEFLGENRELRTIATDFGRVRTVMGAEQVNAVIDRAKQQEQIEAEQKRALRRKRSREVR